MSARSCFRREADLHGGARSGIIGHIETASPIDFVGASTSRKIIVAAAAGQKVVANLAAQPISGGVSEQRVGECRA